MINLDYFPQPQNYSTTEDFNMICRICLRKAFYDGVVTVQPIGAYVNKRNPYKTQDLHEKIRMCSNIELLENDDILPNNICDNCVTLLLIAHYFKVLSANSDEILRRIVNDIKEEKHAIDIKEEFIDPELGEDKTLTESENNEPSSSKNNTCNAKIDDFANSVNTCVTDIPSTSKDANASQSGQTYIESNVTTDTEPSINNEEGNTTDGNDIRKYECSLCDSFFSFKAGLAQHFVFVHETGKYKCYGCNMEVNKYTKLVCHELTDCPKMPPGTKYKCSKCETECETRYVYDHHIKNKCKEKLLSDDSVLIYKCNDCPYSTSRKDCLTSHITNSHVGRNYVCEVCGLVCRRSKVLKSHRKSHKYKCQYCGCEVREQYLLDLHMRVHAEDYKYTCEVCGNRYKSCITYKAHVMRSHEKKFQCDHCNKMFGVKWDLRHHIKSNHLGIKRHNCQECGKPFDRIAYYRNHLFRQHNIVLKKSRK